ncbi:MAG: Uncharacterised protein [Prochlorococcus marinus str. MIT 9215]|nr:MAG: Uncharacterised protein [Prochlorococcus marinus str. MIT 9215]
MQLSGLRERFPQLEQLEARLRNSLARQKVLVAIDDSALVLLAQQQERLMIRHVPLPENLCRHGLPLQPEALGELLADLLLDMDILGGECELLLPMPSCSWRLLCWPDGDPCQDQVKTFRQLHPDMSLPAPQGAMALAETYLALSPVQSASYPEIAPATSLLVGTERAMVQAWIDVATAADLPLLGLEWMLTAAWRGVRQATHEWEGDLAWLLRIEGRWRLILLSDGLPELDHELQSRFDDDQPEELLKELEQVLLAWDRHIGGMLPLAWWITAGDAAKKSLSQVLDNDRYGVCLSGDQPWLPEVLETSELEGPETDFWQSDLASLATLALAGARGDN